MPELPEVETIKLGLQKYLVGHSFEYVDVRMPRMITGDTKNILGAKVVGVERFGKGLVIELDNENSIAIHIKMTGQLIYRGHDIPKDLHPAFEKIGKELPNSATHVIFHLDKDAVLYYNDIRRFGWIKIVRSDDVQKLPFFKELGPEPSVLASQKKVLDLALFSDILQKKGSPIKIVIMDQKLIGGIGNIYANDALYLAKVNPRRPAKSLSQEEVKTLLEAIEHVIKKGLEVGGASEWQYVNALGETGNYQTHFLAYNKKGELCGRDDGGKIEKITLGGRGTYFCQKCQK